MHLVSLENQLRSDKEIHTKTSNARLQHDTRLESRSTSSKCRVEEQAEYRGSAADLATSQTHVPSSDVRDSILNTIA